MYSKKMIASLYSICINAGGTILDIYKNSIQNINFKSDNSPLTNADLYSHETIIKGLKNLDENIPIVSEESENIDYNIRKNWNEYWLIDPLDGTKEFIKRNGEFTVNIALIKNGNPVLGFVYQPVNDTLYYGFKNSAFKVTCASTSFSTKTKLSLNKKNLYRVVASKSHMNFETQQVISKIKKYLNIELLSVGSSLKLCKVADNSADFYPRFAPTMEWDTAAADAICRASGCYILDTSNHKPLKYNKENLLNPHFYVTNSEFIKSTMENIS